MDFAASSWRAAWLIAMLVVLRLLVRGRIPAGIWFVAWLVVGVRLLVPFSVPVQWSPYNFAMIRTPMVERLEPDSADNSIAAAPIVAAVATPAAAAAPSFALDVTKDAPPAANPSMNGPTLWMIGWLIGMMALATMRVAAWWRFRRQITRAGSVEPRVADIIRHEAAAVGIRTAVHGSETAAVDAPALYGIRRPRLLFPPGFAAQLDDEHLRLVIRHELVHWRRRDLLAQALMQTAVVLHWYNPFAWIAARLARVDCELACDAAVLRRENAEGRIAYGSALLRVVALARGRRRPAAAIAIFDAKRHLAQRVRMIAGYRASTAGRVCGGVLLIALIAAASITREARAAERPALRTLATTEEASANETPAPAEPSFEDIVKAQREKIEHLGEELQQLRQQAGLPLDQRKDMLNEALRAGNLELQRAKAASQVAEIRVNQIQEYRANGADLLELPFVASQPLIATLKQHTAEARISLAQLNERYAESHPRVIEARNNATVVEKEMQRAIETICRQIEAENVAAGRMYDQRKEELDQLRGQSLALDREAVKIVRAERALQTQEQILHRVVAQAEGSEANRSAASAASSSAVAASTVGTPPANPRPVDEVFQVSVIGAVNKQDAVGLVARDNPIVLDAIARAGGFSPIADRGGVRIIRSMPDGRRVTLTFSEEEIMAGADPITRMQRGDVLVVPERAPVVEQFANVSGAVNKPGRIALRQGMTLVDVIAEGGGPTRLADLKKVMLTRRDSKTGELRQRAINIDQFMRGTADREAKWVRDRG
jgi:beta-lactamase regulating signal transducer with metallopeptidase domain/DNA uptake protein ComE-like DNA-binding protein